MRSVLGAIGFILCSSGMAWADAGSSYTLAQVATPLPVPMVSYYAPSPVAYQASFGAPATYAAPNTYASQASYYAPAAPVTAYYAPAAPTVVYRPVAPAYAAPVYVGRPAVVRQHLYIRGQPIRNALRVLLP